jgi:exodeoxyribonuclease VII large subunit
MISTFTVSEFIQAINEIITGEFIVEGEVAEYKISQGKWIFFNLKDSQSCLSCFSTVFMLKVPLEDGMRIRVVGYPKIHDKSGRFSFTVQKVELVGEGAMQRAYQLLKLKLEAEGLFDRARKRVLPKFPERVGVIASRDSAAWGDFKRILSNRWAGVEVILRHVTVQGETAVAEVVQAFKEFNTSKIMCDVVVLIRGGGSLEDLIAFNSEEVVQAIYASRIPVISGVGHERDETLTDLVADVRASTPSNAAELLVPDKTEITKELYHELDFITERLVNQVYNKRQRIDFYRSFMMSQFGVHTKAINHLIEKFLYSYGVLEHKPAQQKDFLTSVDILLKNINPIQILKRGFSITRTKQGVLIRDASEVDKGDEIVIELAKGSLKGKII